MTDQTSWSALRKSIVIFGAARQGMSIVKWLGPHADDLLMVTQKPLELEEISKLGLDVAEVDFHSDESLHDVGIGRWVKTIFCALADDSENVFLTLSARALDPHLGILCIAQSQEAGRKMLAAGATTVIDSHEIAAKRINELIHHPTVVEALEHTVLGHSDLMLAEIEIDPDCKLVGHQLSELRLDDYNLVLFGVVDLETGKRV
ncbi:MAG TPA: TrkA family potassium uptake protein, partial [Gammaproteobacteria bacterium]|nr:TrkA family potassium uptake protein [Gammaproteobacteria bacterium]